MVEYICGDCTAAVLGSLLCDKAGADGDTKLRAGHVEQDGQNRTGRARRTGHIEQDGQNRTNRTGQTEQDGQNTTGRT